MLQPLSHQHRHRHLKQEVKVREEQVQELEWVKVELVLEKESAVKAEETGLELEEMEWGKEVKA